LVNLIDNFTGRIPYIKAIRTADVYADMQIKNALTLEREGALEVMYSPFDHIAKHAKLVIVGITPGRVQATNALTAARTHLEHGRSSEEALRAAKLTASFSGSGTRNNLVRMMDEIGLNKLFAIRSTSELFTVNGEQVHFTSALRYPVFVGGENYNGTPHMLKTPVLKAMIEIYLAEEARVLSDAVWLPLGPKPAVALQHLAKLGLLKHEQILDGMPHPSGANAERVAAFLGTKSDHLLSKQTNGRQITLAKTSLVDKINLLSKEFSN
jgi:hypothetical protein